MIVCPESAGHIILNYKKISREYSFSRGGSNTETNVSPFDDYPSLFLTKNGFGFSFDTKTMVSEKTHRGGAGEALGNRRKTFQIYTAV